MLLFTLLTPIKWSNKMIKVGRFANNTGERERVSGHCTSLYKANHLKSVYADFKWLDDM